jgi:DNA-directed RNA polymerase specialized sigma24 family protein
MGGDMEASGEPRPGSGGLMPTSAGRRVHETAAEWPVSFEHLYHERFSPLVKLATLLTGSVMVAEEIVQDAFVRSRRALDVADNPAAYLRVAVVNGCRSFHRRTVMAAHRPVDTLGGYLDPELHELADVLSMLPNRQRTVLVLRYYLDLSEAEIADLLGCRPGTVKSLAYRGLRHLREMLEP